MDNVGHTLAKNTDPRLRCTHFLMLEPVSVIDHILINTQHMGLHVPQYAVDRNAVDRNAIWHTWTDHRPFMVTFMIEGDRSPNTEVDHIGSGQKRKILKLAKLACGKP